VTEAQFGGQKRGGHEMLTLLATRGWSLLTGIVTQSLLARVLAPEGRGLFAVCAMFGTLFGTFFALGSDRGAQYQMMARRQSVSAATTIGIGMLLIASGLAIALGFPLSGSSLPFFRNADPELMRLSMILIPITLGTTFLNLQLAGLRRFERIGVVIVIRVSVYLLALLAFVWYFDLGVRGAIFSMIVSSGLEALLYLRTLRKHDGLRLVIPKQSEIREVLAYGLSYYPARIGTHIDLQASALFLAVIGTRDEVGFFAAASALALRLFIISDSFEAAILPRIASAQTERLDLVGFSLRLSGGLTGLAALALCVLAFPLVKLLYSATFLPAVELIWIMAPGIALYSAGKTLMAYFRATDQAGICSQAIWLGLLVNAGSLLWLYPRVGMVAAAWSMSAGFLVRSLFLACKYHRISGVGLAATWLPGRGDARRILDEIAPSLITPGASEVRFSAGQVLKRQAPEQARIELANTEAALQLSERSNRFSVPQLISADPDAGLLTFEEIPAGESLATLLPRSEPAAAQHLAARSAKALAEIHTERCHGDYSLSNLMYRERDQQLFVLDWSRADWLADREAESRPEFDLCIFLISLFYRRPLEPEAIRDPEALGLSFMRSYAEERRGQLDLTRFQALFIDAIEHFDSNRTAVRGRLRALVYRASLRRALRFVKTLHFDAVAGKS